MTILTVVTPTIPGREDFLEQCKDSVLKQTAGKLPHVVGVDHDREGPAVVRNRLVEQVETPWVLFLDDDDWLEYDYYERIDPHLVDPHEVVYSWCKRVGLKVNLDVEFDADSLRRDNFIPVTACVRTERFRELGGFPPEAGYEDWALWIKILDAAGPEAFCLVKEHLWTYRRHPHSRTYQNQKDIAAGRRPAR